MGKRNFGYAGSTGGKDAGHIVNGASMAGNIAPVVIALKDIDALGFEITWTGAVVGSWKVEVSNSYLPKLNDLQTAVSAGKWTDVTSLLTPAITQPNNNAGTIFVGLAHTLTAMQAKYARISFTNSSSTGTGDVWIAGKTLA